MIFNSTTVSHWLWTFIFRRRSDHICLLTVILLRPVCTHGEIAQLSIICYIWKCNIRNILFPQQTLHRQNITWESGCTFILIACHLCGKTRQVQSKKLSVDEILTRTQPWHHFDTVRQSSGTRGQMFRKYRLALQRRRFTLRICPTLQLSYFWSSFYCWLVASPTLQSNARHRKSSQKMTSNQRCCRFGGRIYRSGKKKKLNKKIYRIKEVSLSSCFSSLSSKKCGMLTVKMHFIPREIVKGLIMWLKMYMQPVLKSSFHWSNGHNELLFFDFFFFFSFESDIVFLKIVFQASLCFCRC